jgi:hypothetical protein
LASPDGGSETPPSTGAKPPAPATLAVAFHREVEGAASAIALEKPPHAAAIGPERLWIHDDKGWRSEALPRSLKQEPAFELSVFYGRDDRVRVVGTRGSGEAAENVYVRGRPGGGLAPEPGEIGRLASRRGALVAVLGTEDPEIVCRPGDVCLVKRRSGWATIAAPADLRRVTLGDGAGWALAGRRLLRLGEGGWTDPAPAGAWDAADRVFALRDRAWVIETMADRVFSFDGSRWTEIPSPIERPRAMWGTSADALWLVGDGGLAFFDGSAWRRAREAPGPLAAVAGRDPRDVWVAGARGVFRVERAD